MRCTYDQIDLVMHPPPAPRITTAGSPQNRDLPDLIHPHEINHCVPDSRALLFGRFPCEVATQYCPVLPWLLVCYATSRVAIIALLPDGSDDRELHPFTWLARPEPPRR